MNDITENLRRAMVQDINAQVMSDDEAAERERLKTIYGDASIWNTKQLQEKFEVLGFMAPFCVVRDRVTRVKGSVMFVHSPRLYFNWQQDN
jgi:hypothetical protein